MSRSTFRSASVAPGTKRRTDLSAERESHHPPLRGGIALRTRKLAVARAGGEVGPKPLVACGSSGLILPSGRVGGRLPANVADGVCGVSVDGPGRRATKERGWLRTEHTPSTTQNCL